MLSELKPLVDKSGGIARTRARCRAATLKVKLADFELASRSRTATSVGNRDALGVGISGVGIVEGSLLNEKGGRIFGGFDFGSPSEKSKNPNRSP